MNFWIAVILCVAVAIISGVFTYLVTRLRTATESAQQARALGEAVTALENEKAKHEQAAKAARKTPGVRHWTSFWRIYVWKNGTMCANTGSCSLTKRA